MLLLVRFFLIVSVAFSMNIAVAQHSDVWLVVDNNQITVSPQDLDDPQNLVDVLIDQTTGRYLFPSTYPTGDTDNANPGFQSQSGVFTANSFIYFHGVGSLWYWDGTAWVNSVPNDEQIAVRDTNFPSGETIINPAGVTQADGFITQVSSGGSIHQHIVYRIQSASGGAIATGAYLIDLTLFATSTQDPDGPVEHTESEPFRIALNYGLDQADFDEAISALTNPVGESVTVPLPIGWLVVLSGLLFSIGSFSRSRLSKASPLN